MLKAFSVLILSIVPACALDNPEPEPTQSEAQSEILTVPDQPQPTIYPTCAQLGCTTQPSGSPNIWEPCTHQLCYCYTTACTR